MSKTDHLDAIRPIAAASGYTTVYDSGPCLDGRLVIFGDAEFARDYLHGRGVRGTAVYVRFSLGVIESAKLCIDNARMGLVTSGSTGEHLVWTAKLFIENPVTTRESATREAAR